MLEGLLQVNDENAYLLAWAQDAIDAQPQAADRMFAMGKTLQLVGFIGEVMEDEAGALQTLALYAIQLLATLRS